MLCFSYFLGFNILFCLSFGYVLFCLLFSMSEVPPATSSHVICMADTTTLLSCTYEYFPPELMICSTKYSPQKRKDVTALVLVMLPVNATKHIPPSSANGSTAVLH